MYVRPAYKRKTNRKIDSYIRPDYALYTGVEFYILIRLQRPVPGSAY